MAAVQPTHNVADCPPDLVDVALSNAAIDADEVGLFLACLGVKGTPEKPLKFPRAFLLHLGVALRLLYWEAQGYFFHQTAGLPQGSQALKDAFRALAVPTADPTELSAGALRVFVENFAWHARRSLNADVAIDGQINDDALDALAEYLWASRDDGRD